VDVIQAPPNVVSTLLRSTAGKHFSVYCVAGGESQDMGLFRAAISAAFVAIGALSRADPSPTIHYAPAENLEHIDVELLDSAKHEIDFAAHVLTDWPIMQALAQAAKRGVKVRIYLDATQLAAHEPARVLTRMRGVEIRVKRGNSALMHLKSYEIDGRVLHTGAANFSASGPKCQDNDLAVIMDTQAAAKFKHSFEARFARGTVTWQGPVRAGLAGC
jgi:phosphatidylserine/phosphatidylglycerophosphate/cardiolipin synthase-like enzyme